VRYLVAIVALGLLIAVHELGHLIFARLFGVRVDRYAVGFGPALFAFKRGATEYSLRAIPIGGFVQIHGMNPYEEGLSPEDPTSYATLAWWKRTLILLGGPLLNYAVAVTLLSGLYLTGTHVPVPMTVGTVEPGSVAARAQLRPGDVVLTVDGARMDTWSALADRLSEGRGRTLQLGILRNGDVTQVPVRPGPDGRVGVQQQYVFRQQEFKQALGSAFAHTERLAVEGLALTWRLLRGSHGAELSGPFGVLRATSGAAEQSLDALLRMIVALSVALAIFNILPFPALDGGRILFVLIGAITGRAVPAALETVLHLVGFVVLAGLAVWIAFADLRVLLHHEPPPESLRPPAMMPLGPPPGTVPALTPRPRAPDAGLAPDAGR